MLPQGDEVAEPEESEEGVHSDDAGHDPVEPIARRKRRASV